MTGCLVHTFGGEIPPCARCHNKEYLLNTLPTIESSVPAFHGIISGTRDGTRSAWLQDPLRTGLPRVPPGFPGGTPSPLSDHWGSRQGPSKGVKVFFFFSLLSFSVLKCETGHLKSSRKL